MVSQGGSSPRPMMHIAYFPLISTKCLNFFPYFCKIYKFPNFRSIGVFMLNLRFCFPYFDHDAFRHRAIHVGGHPFMTSTQRREGVRLRWTHVDGGGGPAPCGRPHRKLKLESTDVILSSSHAKKLASFFTRISSLDRKSGNYTAI